MRKVPPPRPLRTQQVAPEKTVSLYNCLGIYPVAPKVTAFIREWGISEEQTVVERTKRLTGCSKLDSRWRSSVYDPASHSGLRFCKLRTVSPR